MIKTAFEYHQATSYDRHDMSGHYLDWKNQPMVFKDYPGIPPVVLPAEVEIPPLGLVELIHQENQENPEASMGLKDLSAIFRLSYSLTARARQGGGDFYFRSAASAGALYPCEIYTAAHGIDGLEDGLYHFAVHRHCLVPLRRGDLTPWLAKYIPSVTDKRPHLTFLLTAVYFRSAWKYRDRSYRYHLLDTGHLLENLVLTLQALNLIWELTFDFSDEEVNRLLGLDENKEVCLAVVSVSGPEPSLKAEDLKPLLELPPSFTMASRVSAQEVDYPAVREIHGAGKVFTESSQHHPHIPTHLGLNIKAWIEPPAGKNRPVVMDFADAIYRRRSRRNFIREPLKKDQTGVLLDALGRAEIDSGLRKNYFNTMTVGLLINLVQGIEPGFYLLDGEKGLLGLVRAGSYGPQTAQMCLDQAWLSNAAIHVLFITNLQLVEKTRGPRGYRYAMMSAGRLGQRTYLLATAMNLGCCGIGAFYDQEASDLLGINQDSRLLYLVAVGPIKSG